MHERLFVLSFKYVGSVESVITMSGDTFFFFWGEGGGGRGGGGGGLEDSQDQTDEADLLILNVHCITD